MHEHTLNNAGDNAELVAGLNGFFEKAAGVDRDLRLWVPEAAVKT